MKPGDKFRHFKSGEVYRIVCLYTWEPTKEAAVLYEHEETGARWGRPVSVFMEEVQHGQPPALVRRFAPVPENSYGVREVHGAT